MTDNSAPAVQVATPVVQEPSNPSTEVKNDVPEQSEESPKSDADRQKELFEKRIARQTAANRDTQRHLEEARKRIADLETQINKASPVSDKPISDNYDSPEDYAEALADWKIAQKEKERAEPKAPDVETIRKQEREFAQKQISFASKENEFRAKEPNYDQSAAVVNKLMSLAQPNDPSFVVFAQTIMDAENAPALIHYLGSNPNEALGLFGKSPAEVEDALLVIIDKLDAPKPGFNGEAEAIPEALPAPPSPLKGKAGVKKTPDQMTGRELIKHLDGLTRRGK